MAIQLPTVCCLWTTTHHEPCRLSRRLSSSACWAGGLVRWGRRLLMTDSTSSSLVRPWSLDLSRENSAAEARLLSASWTSPVSSVLYSCRKHPTVIPARKAIKTAGCYNRVNRSWQWIKRLSKLRCRSRLMINWPANQKCRILNKITWQWQSKFIIIIYRTFAGPLMSCRLCISMLQTVPSSDVVCIGTYTIYVEHLM